MGDFWQHDLRLEHAAQRAPVPLDSHKPYPVCTDGNGDCPPEDCGGPWGYRELMAERDSWLSLLQMQDDQALVAQQLLDWCDGGPRPTNDDAELGDALERVRGERSVAHGEKGTAMHFRIHLVTVADDAAEHQQAIADLIRTEATLETTGLMLT